MFIRLFLFGELRGEWVQNIEDDFLEVGLVHVTGDDPFSSCVEDLTDGDASNTCPGF